MAIALLPTQNPDSFAKVSLARSGHGEFLSLCTQVSGSLLRREKWKQPPSTPVLRSTPVAWGQPASLTEQGEACRLRRLEPEGKA